MVVQDSVQLSEWEKNAAEHEEEQSRERPEPTQRIVQCGAEQADRRPEDQQHERVVEDRTGDPSGRPLTAGARLHRVVQRPELVVLLASDHLVLRDDPLSGAHRVARDVDRIAQLLSAALRGNAVVRDRRAEERAEQFDVLKEFVRSGKVRHVGLSEVSVPDIEEARQYVPIVSVQNRYNAFDRKWDDVVEYCEREGIAFIPWAPLDSGRMEKKQDITMVEAIAWLLHRSPIMLPIPGTSKVKHLEENMKAAELEAPDFTSSART